MTDITYALIAQKRAIHRPPVTPATGKDEMLVGWMKDEEGFLRRWPDNTRPDTGTARSRDYKALATKAAALNEAQLRGGFLDWLYVVDVDFPVHMCTPTCNPNMES